MIRWFKWWFFETRKCDHITGAWYFREVGMGKSRHCIECGKCIDLI